MYDHDLDTNVVAKHRLSPQAKPQQLPAAAEAPANLLQPYDLLTPLSGRRRATALVSAQAAVLNRATASQPARASQALLQLQRQYGNRYVQRVLIVARQGEGPLEASPGVEQAIQGARSSGRALDGDVRARLEPAFGADFSGVRVHTGVQADTLNRALSARAFTTGKDIFFREGSYNPGSSSGRELLAHELTHVVQQTGGIQRQLTVGQPGDQYEQEADRVAQAVMQHEHQAVPTEVAAGPSINRQEEEKKKEPIQTKADDTGLQRQGEEENKEEE